MKNLIFFACLFLKSCQHTNKIDATSNVAKIDKFFELVFTNPDAANDLLHEDFTFQFMGICEICKSYNKETFVRDWIKKDIPAVLLNGRTLHSWSSIGLGNKSTELKDRIKLIEKKIKNEKDPFIKTKIQFLNFLK